mmetsp:Transcript_21047/g.54384  ORF Transcript_21047/g.54384 Transcript_21047/m.54384 type:complete len:223 (-) Transcript_21047:6346-7014(-)
MACCAWSHRLRLPRHCQTPCVPRSPCTEWTFCGERELPSSVTNPTATRSGGETVLWEHLEAVVEGMEDLLGSQKQGGDATVAGHSETRDRNNGRPGEGSRTASTFALFGTTVPMTIRRRLLGCVGASRLFRMLVLPPKEERRDRSIQKTKLRTWSRRVQSPVGRANVPPGVVLHERAETFPSREICRPPLRYREKDRQVPFPFEPFFVASPLFFRLCSPLLR